MAGALTPFFPGGIGMDPFAVLDQAMDRAFSRALGGRPSDLVLTVPSFGNVAGGGSHPMDVIEAKDKYLLRADAPGFTPEEVNVEVHDNVLTISGNKEETKEDRDKEGRVVRRERTFNTFRRSFTLPEDVRDEGIAASLDKGVLTVTVPKRPETEKPAPKRITVAAGSD